MINTVAENLPMSMVQRQFSLIRSSWCDYWIVNWYPQ